MSNAARPGTGSSAKTLKVLAWPRAADRALNPYASLLYQGLESAGGVEVSEFSLKRLFLGGWDIVHVHWPDGFWPRHALPVSAAFAGAFLAGLTLARLRGARLIWTTHNAAAHERRHEWGRKLYMRGFTALCDGTISFSAENRAAILDMHPRLAGRPNLVTAHGLYDDHHPRTTLSQHECRDRLGLPAGGKVLLALGNLRPYKDYPRLIRAFRDLPAQTRARWTLLIIGRSGDGHGAELAHLAEGRPEIIVRDVFVPDEDISICMTAADLVVLPYLTMQNSGAANLAVTFGKPVLAPGINSFLDMAQSHPGMVHLFADEIDAAKLQAGLESDHAATPPDWREARARITAQTLGFYRDLAAAR